MCETLHVFVSGTKRDLEPERAAVLEVIQRHHMVAHSMEYFGADEREAKKGLRQIGKGVITGAIKGDGDGGGGGVAGDDPTDRPPASGGSSGGSEGSDAPAGAQGGKADAEGVPEC